MLDKFSATAMILPALLLCACGGGGGVSTDGPAAVNTPVRNTAITLSRNSMQVSQTTDDGAPIDSVDISVSNFPTAGLYAATESTSQGVQSVDFFGTTQTNAQVVVYFKKPSTLGPGTYSDVVRVSVCYDQACASHVQGSPAQILTTYTITQGTGGGTPTPPPGPQPEPGLTPVPVSATQALPHDVIDAEYSAALDAVVMVSSYPSNSLYLYDTASGTKKSVALNKLPTSVSVSPNGLAAAVGHDALVSVVDLASIGTSGSPSPVLLNVSAPVFDLVLDGGGYVHVFPAADQHVNIHSVQISSNTEYLNSGRTIYEDTRGKLHPDGVSMYGADNNISPSDIEKYNVSAGRAAYLYDSPYHGDYAMCGNLWFSESGTQIYTACGNVFRSSPSQTQDMVYAGAMRLSTSTAYSYRVLSLSQSSEIKQIALIEKNSYECDSFGDSKQCYTHLAIYESDFLNRQQLYSFPPMRVAGNDYAQRGLFVFHKSNGSQKFIISKLFAMPNPDAEFYLSTMN